MYQKYHNFQLSAIKMWPSYLPNQSHVSGPCSEYPNHRMIAFMGPGTVTVTKSLYSKFHGIFDNTQLTVKCCSRTHESVTTPHLGLSTSQSLYHDYKYSVLTQEHMMMSSFICNKKMMSLCALNK